MKARDILSEAGQPKQTKTRNPVAHAAQKVAKGSGVHKDKKKSAKQGDVKHKKDIVAEGTGDYRTKTMKVFKDKSGKPVGEIGIDLDSNPEAQDWYVHHYDTGYNVLGFDNATQAKKELMYVHKHPESVSEQGVAEGEYDDPRWEPREPDMSRKVDWDIEADRNNRNEEESTSTVYIIDDNTDEVVLKFKSTGGYYGDVRHALKHGYDTEGGDYRIKWKKVANETATAGSTSAGNIASVANPHVAIGNRKAYGKGAAAKPPKAAQAKNPDGTAKNALDLPSASLFGGSNIKR